MLRIMKELLNKKSSVARNDPNNSTLLEFPRFSLGLAPYEEFLSDCYKCNDKSRKEVEDRLQFNYYELNREDFCKELTAVAQLDAVGIDQFLGLKDFWCRYFEYQTTHGVRKFSLHYKEETVFEVLYEGDGFAKAVERCNSSKGSQPGNNVMSTCKNHFKLNSANYQSPVYLDIVQNSYDPLLIIGSQGCGKSTLLAGILKQAQANGNPIIGIKFLKNGSSRSIKRVTGQKAVYDSSQLSFNPFAALNLTSLDKNKSSNYQALVAYWITTLVAGEEPETSCQTDYQISIIIKSMVDRFFNDPIFRSYYSGGSSLPPNLADFVLYVSEQLQALYKYKLGLLLPENSTYQLILSRLKYWLNCNITCQAAASQVIGNPDLFVITIPNKLTTKDGLVKSFTNCLIAFKYAVERSQQEPRPIFFVDGDSTVFQCTKFNQMIKYFYAYASRIGVKIVVCSRQPIIHKNWVSGSTLIGHIEPSSTEAFKQNGYDEDFLRRNAVEPLDDRANYSSWSLYSRGFAFVNYSDCFVRYHST